MSKCVHLYQDSELLGKVGFCPHCLKEEYEELKEEYNNLFDIAENYNYRGGEIVLHNYLKIIKEKGFV